MPECAQIMRLRCALQPLIEHSNSTLRANIEALNVVLRGHTNLGMPQLLGRIVEPIGAIDRRRHRLANRLRTHPIETSHCPNFSEMSPESASFTGLPVPPLLFMV